jgi:hypothetical protein
MLLTIQLDHPKNYIFTARSQHRFVPIGSIFARIPLLRSVPFLPLHESGSTCHMSAHPLSHKTVLQGRQDGAVMLQTVAFQYV